ncbi:DUF1700 domain-containing protein [Actinokineospora enzanensis]|uniref:DUF1700 domain-containing protein n=1 Tax=Actinokineospora enzanensis TaxID=155975 RepID=UPI00036FE473|nr:hypothetical protein [Actinokineospora enzanensis]
MNGTDTRPEVADYLRRVRAALADLPADELSEVMEDVEPHVAEVLDEAGSAEELTRRLGTPEEYAAELRAAGGYPAPAVPRAEPTRWVAARYAVWGSALLVVTAFISGALAFGHESARKYAVPVMVLVAVAPALWMLVGRALSRDDIEAVREFRWLRARGQAIVALLSPAVIVFVRSLRPGWWLLRVALVVLAFFSGHFEGTLVVVLAAAVASWAGPRSSTDRRVLPIAVAANTFLAGALIALLAVGLNAMHSRRDDRPVYIPSGLSYEGRTLSNLYAVDPDGKPIPDFYLYDEAGSPITVEQPSCHDYDDTSRPGNRFPLPEIQYLRGACVETSDNPFVPRPPRGSATPTGTPAPSTTPGTSTPEPGTTSQAPSATSSAPPTTTAPTTTLSPTTTPPVTQPPVTTTR